MLGILLQAVSRRDDATRFLRFAEELCPVGCAYACLRLFAVGKLHVAEDMFTYGESCISVWFDTPWFHLPTFGDRRCTFWLGPIFAFLRSCGLGDIGV